MIKEIKALMLEDKHRMRQETKFYSQDLLNNLFSHPYTKIEFVENDLDVHRNTAAKYLDELADLGFIVKIKIVNQNYYLNQALYHLLENAGAQTSPKNEA